MSIKVMSLVWQLDCEPHDKLLLLALADWADDDGGSIFPSVARMASKSRMSERSVQRRLCAFRDSGLLIPVAWPRGGRGHATEYRLVLEPKKGANVTPFALERVPATVVKGANGGGKGDTALAPHPLVDPSVDPPENTASAPKVPSRTPVVLDHFATRFKAKTGQTYPGPYAKDGKLVKGLPAAYTAAALVALVDRFFDEPDPWVAEHGGFTVGVFVAQLAKMVGQEAPPGGARFDMQRFLVEHG